MPGPVAGPAGPPGPGLGSRKSQAGQKAVKAQLTDRIVHRPFAAMRLSVLLNNVVQDYEKRYGKLEFEARRPEGFTIQ